MRHRTILMCILVICFFVWFRPLSFSQDDFQVIKKVDIGQFSLWMELLIKDPTKTKIEAAIESLVKKFGDRTRLQIDIFDNLEALQRRLDEKYPTKLVYRHWLVSITDKEVHRFYLKERTDIK